MKLTATHKVSRKAGMTLLELTVVILVLLSLISILFIGARAWKKGSDRAASILQIRNVQQAVRSYGNMNGLNPGDTIATTDIFGAGKFIEKDPTVAPATHPAGTTYSFAFTDSGTKIPLIGVLYMTTTGGTDAADYNPKAGTFSDW